MSSLSDDEKMESDLSSKSRWSDDGWGCLCRTDHSLVSLGSGGWAAEELAKGIMARSDYRGMRVSVRLLPQRNPNAYSISAGIRVNDLAFMEVLAPPDAWQRAGRAPPRNIRCAEVYGTSTTQEELFEEVNPAIVHAMSGRGTGAVFCFGATGTGKSYTMGGPIEKNPDMGSSDPEAGMLQRSAEHMFKYIDERRSQGHYFNIKAQYLLIEVLPDGDRYMDLLTGQPDVQLKVKRSGSTYTAVGLSERQITSSSQMIEVYVNARHRIAKLDEDKELEADCCHCLLMLDIESEVEIEGGARVPKFKTKLFFGDLAGCEMFESDPLVTDERKQRSVKIWEQFDSLIEIASELPKGFVLAKPEEAQGIDTVPNAAYNNINTEFCSNNNDSGGKCSGSAAIVRSSDALPLAAAPGNAPKRKAKLSTLARLLHDLVRFESTSRSVMISTINTEPGKLNDLANTLNFAHQMNYVKVLHKPEGVARRDAIPKTIQKTHSLKAESERCLQAVRETIEVLESREEEVVDLRTRLSKKVTKKKEMAADHAREMQEMHSKMEILNSEMREMAAEMTTLKSKACEEMAQMKTSMEEHFTETQGITNKRLQEVEIQLESALMEKRDADEQAAALKARNEELEVQLKSALMEKSDADEQAAAFKARNNELEVQLESTLVEKRTAGEQAAASKARSDELEVQLESTLMEKRTTEEQAAAFKARNDEFEVQLESTLVEKRTAEEEVAVLKARTEDLEAQQQTSEQMISELRMQLASQEEKVSGLESENADLKTQLDTKICETTRLTDELALKVEAFASERSAWSAKEASFLEDLKNLSMQLEESKTLVMSSQGEVSAQKAENMSLKAENESLKEEIAEASTQLQDETTKFRAREAELMEMLDQLQAVIIQCDDVEGESERDELEMDLDHDVLQDEAMEEEEEAVAAEQHDIGLVDNSTH